MGDPAGVIFFGHVFTLAHQAYEQFVIHKFDISWGDWFSNSEWILPLKHTEASYQTPLIAGKICLIDVKIEEVRTSSFSLICHFYQENILCCIVKTLHIFCDKNTRKKINIPSAILAKILEN